MCRDKGKFPRYNIALGFIIISHTDIPFAMNLIYKNIKYRFICTDN